MPGLLAVGYLAGCVVAGQLLPGAISAGVMFAGTMWISCIESHERERGIWMLWTLIIVPCGALAVMSAIRVVADVRAGRGAFGEHIDFGCALVVLVSTLWVVASAGYWNWRQFRSGGGMPPESNAGVPAPRDPRRPVLSAHAMQDEAGR